MNIEPDMSVSEAFDILQQRIAALEAAQHYEQLKSEAMDVLDFSRRIAALEAAQHKSHEQLKSEAIAVLVTQLTDFSQRITQLEDKLNPPPTIATTLWDQEVENRIAALEASLNKLEQCALREINFTLDRIATLENPDSPLAKRLDEHFRHISLLEDWYTKLKQSIAALETNKPRVPTVEWALKLEERVEALEVKAE